MLSYKNKIRYAFTKMQIDDIVQELEELLSLAKEKQKAINEDKEVIIINCSDKMISVLKGSKVQVDSWGTLISNYDVLEQKGFGRPNTKKYNAYKQEMINKYKDKLYKVIG
jgi:hypothetical protein